jgi:maltooligosyltrehalose trehalohydrolase
MNGERLSVLVDLERQKLAAGCVLLSPFVPLIFMGEEYGETAPFQYFISHTDEELVQAVRRGRSEEFSAFRWHGAVPDPQAESTFERCVLDHSLAERGHHESHRKFYRELIRLRKGLPAIDLAEKRNVEVRVDTTKQLLLLLYEHESGGAGVLLHFAAQPGEHVLALPGGEWRVLLDSADARWAGPGRTLPDRVHSHSHVAVRMQPNSLVLLSQQPTS